MVDKKLNIIQQRAQKANGILGSIRRRVASREQGGDCPSLLCPCEAPSGVLHPGLGLATLKRCGAVGTGLEKAMKMIRGVEHLSYEEKLRELGLISLQMRRLRGDLTVAFQYLKVCL